MFALVCMKMQIHSLPLGAALVKIKWQPPAPSRETNTEVTKTAIHRLAAGGWLQKEVGPVDSPC